MCLHECAAVCLDQRIQFLLRFFEHGGIFTQKIGRDAVHQHMHLGIQLHGDFDAEKHLTANLLAAFFGVFVFRDVILDELHQHAVVDIGVLVMVRQHDAVEPRRLCLCHHLGCVDAATLADARRVRMQIYQHPLPSSLFESNHFATASSSLSPITAVAIAFTSGAAFATA